MRWIRGGSDVESGRQLREREREIVLERERLERERGQSFNPCWVPAPACLPCKCPGSCRVAL